MGAALGYFAIANPNPEKTPAMIAASVGIGALVGAFGGTYLSLKLFPVRAYREDIGYIPSPTLVLSYQY
jgi:hypothetical protein